MLDINIMVELIVHVGLKIVVVQKSLALMGNKHTIQHD